VNIATAVCLGVFSVQRTALLASIPLEAGTGLSLRSLAVSAVPMDGDPTAYWVMRVGSISARGFVTLASEPFSVGFGEVPRVVSFTPELPMRAGTMLAIRMTPTSSAASPITGLSVVPDFALTGARAR